MDRFLGQLDFGCLRRPQLWARWQRWRQGLGVNRRRRASGETTALPIEPGQPCLRETILVVRINEGVCDTVPQALSDSGYDVRIVEGLPHAQESLARQQPSLVIVCGPGIRRACVALRHITTAPILALLPVSTEAEIIAVLNAGADDCQATSMPEAHQI